MKRSILPAILICLLILCGCAKDAPASMEPWELPEGKGSRDNTPVCLVPVSDKSELLGNEEVTIDVSSASEGFLIAHYHGDNGKVKLQITGKDEVTYTYDLATGGGADEVFPFSADDGDYEIAVYENIRVNQYATVFSEIYNVKLRDEFLPFLYPNQYVRFTEDSEAVAMAETLAAPAESDLDVISNVYNYIIRNIVYDTAKAETVQSGYIPQVDEILSSGEGICLDYAALMTAMLRSQQIPTRMEVGYAGTAYHAWLSSYIENVGWVNGVIQFDGQHWELMDPTFAASTGADELERFIGDGDNYVLKYIY